MTRVFTHRCMQTSAVKAESYILSALYSLSRYFKGKYLFTAMSYRELIRQKLRVSEPLVSNKSAHKSLKIQTA